MTSTGSETSSLKKDPPTPQTLTASDVAELIGIPLEKLKEIAEDTASVYFPKEIRLVKGKERPIDQPVTWFKTRLAALQRELQKVFIPHPIVHGGVRRRSCFTAACEHLGREVIVQRDIKDCYPSISTQMMERELLARRVSPDVALMLARIFTVRGYIPQGSPISGVALNVFMHRFDHSIASYAGSHGLRVTRTYDDVVISFNNLKIANKVARKLDREITRIGLRINEKKRKSRGLQTRNRPQYVHNLVVNSRRGVKMHPEKARQLVREAQEYYNAAKRVTADTAKDLVPKRRRLMGAAANYARTYNGPAPLIRRLIEEGDRKVEAVLRRSGRLWANRRFSRIANRPDLSAYLAKILRPPEALAPAADFTRGGSAPFDPS